MYSVDCFVKVVYSVFINLNIYFGLMIDDLSLLGFSLHSLGSSVRWEYSVL